ncbi:MAG TPA: RNA polymerase sigma factor SigJ [Polyangiaceae bacterium]|jgi:RNA polymerase sigma-70 factor (ECF subfamily)|nr:RNA polymerase sigma factor SigJ [Polyangiaceae bacterium]
MSGSAVVFEQHRRRLLRLAYRMLGTMSDAEDVVQDAYLRFHRADVESVQSPEAWLVTVVTRLALDRFRAAKTERRAYVGPWLPEPWMQGARDEETPDARSQRKSELSYAALVLLDRLEAEERAAFLLREVFDVDYGVVAAALERNEAACRQLVHRARERVFEGKPRRRSTAAEQEDLLRRLHAAAETQNTDALAKLFDPDAVFVSDGGGKVSAALRSIHGADRLVRVTQGVARKERVKVSEIRFLDAEPALVTWWRDQVRSVTFVDARDGMIHAVYKVLNPNKIREVGPPPTASRAAARAVGP